MNIYIARFTDATAQMRITEHTCMYKHYIWLKYYILKPFWKEKVHNTFKKKSLKRQAVWYLTSYLAFSPDENDINTYV